MQMSETNDTPAETPSAKAIAIAALMRATTKEKANMGNFFKAFGKAIADLFTSKKFLVTVGTVVAQAVVKDPTLAHTLVGTGAAYVLGQGLADFGKNAKPPTTQ